MKIRPEKLNKGDTIGVISPSGAVKEKKMLENALKYFEARDFKVKIAPHVLDKKAYLAGEDAFRLSDLESFFKDGEVKAIICSRGGYGAFRILNDINYDLIKNNPKIFVGYSDLTALLNNFTQKSGLITFHGPLFASDFGGDRVDRYTEDNFWNIVTKNIKIPYEFTNPSEYHCINPGKTRGELFGGNLAIMCGLLGTPYMPDLTGKLLLVEDVGEPLYKIDRMITQLKLAGVFETVVGVLFAEFSSVIEPDNNDTDRVTVLDVLAGLTSELKIPVGYGFPAGHGPQKATLPIGAEYLFDSDNFKLELTEDYLRNRIICVHKPTHGSQ